jgi:CRP/FNR family transcriptional regulator
MPVLPRLRSVGQRANCTDCQIRHRAVCAHCEPDELSLLESMKSYRDYRAGETILWAGEPLTMVGSVVSGVVSLARAMEDGRRQMGRPDRALAPYDAVAATDVTLCCFQRQPFQKLVVASPAIGRRMLAMTFDELDAARDWMLLLGRMTAREKIASFLCILARRTQATAARAGDGLTVDLPLTREAMADYLGLTVETVSRQITALRQDGVIRLQGQRQVVITSFRDLLVESGEDSDGGMPD